MPRARAAAQLFLGRSSGQSKLLRRNVLPLAHPTAKARARSARYQLLRENREFCGSERCSLPKELQSRALQGNPSLARRARIKAGKMRRGHHSSLSSLSERSCKPQGRLRPSPGRRRQFHGPFAHHSVYRNRKDGALGPAGRGSFR